MDCAGSLNKFSPRVTAAVNLSHATGRFDEELGWKHKLHCRFDYLGSHWDGLCDLWLETKGDDFSIWRDRRRGGLLFLRHFRPVDVPFQHCGAGCDLLAEEKLLTEHATAFRRRKDFPFSRFNAGEVKVPNPHAHQAQRRVSHRRGHPPNLAVFSFD